MKIFSKKSSCQNWNFHAKIMSNINNYKKQIDYSKNYYARFYDVQYKNAMF